MRHSVYTCCNHFMDIFERQIVKRQTRLFCPVWGRRQRGFDVFSQRDFPLIVAVQWAFNRKVQTFIVPTDKAWLKCCVNNCGMASELCGNVFLSRCGACYWVNICDGALSSVFSTSVGSSAPFLLVSFFLSGSQPQFPCHTIHIFWSARCTAL